MSDDTLRTLVPPVLRPLVPELFDVPRPIEPKATCDSCAMCPKAGEQHIATRAFFQPDLKCCTYYPHLPNFLVGAILEDRGEVLAEGKRRVQEKIRERYGVTPYFLSPPRRYSVLHAAARTRAYGRSKVLLCPYFAEGERSCTIWRHRTGVCATFFCKHERGGAGRRFWLALEKWLTYAERALAEWAAKRVDADVVEPSVAQGSMTLDDLEERPPGDKDYASWWKGWVGREEKFYRACFAEVSRLDRAEAAKILARDAEEKTLSNEVRARHETLTRPTLAKRLVVGKNVKVQKVDGGVAVSGYSPLDVQLFEEGLYDVIAQMRADEPVDAFLARMQKEHEIELAPELLLYLQLFEILVPPAEAEAAAAASEGEDGPEAVPADDGVDAPFEPEAEATS